MKLPTSLSCLTLTLLMAGCATPQVITATDQSITIDIRNTGLTTGEMIANGTALAEAHCAKFGKKASLENTSGFWGAAHIARFKCE
jgi:hypothetical protein